MDALFLARLEQLLYLYALPYDERFPVVCFDERPCFLIGERVEGMAMKAGQAAREHYSYTKHGSCALLMALEPKTGTRLARVYERRTKQEYARFLKELAASYPAAEKIRLVQDNLNTHTIGSLYEAFTPEEARRLARRLEIHPTPVHGGWLNMAETELSILERQCLDRRLEAAATVRAEVIAWEAPRNRARVTINWRFTVADARVKLKSVYPSIKG